MLPQYLVRVGVLGQVGRFTAVASESVPRSARVICRTKRGLEVGEVLVRAENASFDADGALLRRVTIEDDLLIARIARRKDEAFAACSSLLAARGIEATLMDVEHLFDGRAVYFYFLGEVTPAIESITSELATAYDSAVEFKKFADLITEGCGPGCGTEDSENGCSSGACSSCGVASACGT